MRFVRCSVGSIPGRQSAHTCLCYSLYVSLSTSPSWSSLCKVQLTARSVSAVPVTSSLQPEHNFQYFSNSQIYQGSQWSSPNITVLSLVETFIMMKYYHYVATPALSCHKEPAQDTQSPSSLWHKDRCLPCRERIYYRPGYISYLVALSSSSRGSGPAPTPTPAVWPGGRRAGWPTSTPGPTTSWLGWSLSLGA